MKKEIKKLSFYVIMIIVFGSLMYLIAQKGSSQHSSNQEIIVHAETHSLHDGFHLFSHLTLEHIQSSIGILLLQIIIILAVCRVAGLLFKKIGQPSVIGEIVAGIILGPSVLGYFFPQVSLFIFPEESFSNIRILSQFGLILFMYTIGMELDLSVVKKRFQDTILISHASTIVPFFLGMLMAYFIYDDYAYAEGPFLSFALFIGISLSITAFPVLARIIQERGMTKTHLGSISLASAANGDITAWCLLAAVVAYAQAGSMNSAIFNVLFSLVYIAIMFFMIRPLLRIIGDLYHNKEVVHKSLVALMFFILLASSYVTEILGLHALFGAFIAGMIMPENMKFRKIMNEKVEDISLALFLPLFFVYTGLRTEIGLINGQEMWILCGVFILVAVVGKFGGTLIAARISNESWKNSLYMGALMNTRGLMELVVLSIGLEMKILTPTVFVILVLMTLVTTFMTSPLISFISLCFRTSERIKRNREERLKTNAYKVLLSFGRASNGQVMLDLAHQMFSKKSEKLDVTALHLTVGSDVNPLRTEDFEKVSFAPILYEANKLNMLIKTRYDVCDNAEQHICSIVNTEGFDFLLVGAGISMSDLSTDVTAHKTWRRVLRIFRRKKSGNFIFYPGSLIKDKTKGFIERSNCSVGVFANRGFIRAENILVVFNSEKDLVLLDYVNTLQQSTQGFVKLMNRVSPISVDSEAVADALSGYLKRANETAIPFEKNLTADILKEADLMLVSYATWLILSEECRDILQDMPSTFIIEHKELVEKAGHVTKKR
ncbi:MAG TPA: cation/H(+) antiporter [Porphyromonadaceae bacterium]|nr:cation/H(+) antiporter [Porphyromonadaceae bacterium]